MGTNRRYPHVVDRQMNERILERASQEGPLQSLTPGELQLDRLPLTIDPKPRMVKAWVRFGSAAVIVDARAARWTPRAIGIEFEVAGKTMRTWVWASAVEQLVEHDERAPATHH